MSAEKQRSAEAGVCLSPLFCTILESVSFASLNPSLLSRLNPQVISTFRTRSSVERTLSVWPDKVFRDHVKIISEFSEIVQVYFEAPH